MQVLSEDVINALPSFSDQTPLRLLLSACLTGERCGVDGTSYGEYPWIVKLAKLSNVKPVTFCPEHFSFGTPRDMPDICGGNGFDVLDGKAKVLSDKGEDLTKGMVAAANKMLNLAKQNSVDLSILMDMSAACGSQVISDGCRLLVNRKYQKGPGVCAALLIRNGIKVISQRDFRSIRALFKKLNSDFDFELPTIDHNETEWYRDYFPK